ncbi:MAG: hypothetical protein E7367_01195 [Clostridiales bacterium]|nr:hypothetical protein [Clostridiales bacterium]
MEGFLDFINTLLLENPIVGILFIILLIALVIRFVGWLFDKLMSDKGVLGDITNIIVWLVRWIIKIVIVLIILAGLAYLVI